MGERVFAAECIQKKRIRKVYKCWVCPSNWQYITFLQVLAFVQKNNNTATMGFRILSKFRLFFQSEKRLKVEKNDKNWCLNHKNSYKIPTV